MVGRRYFAMAHLTPALSPSEGGEGAGIVGGASRDCFRDFLFLFELSSVPAACWPHEPHSPHWCLYCWCGPRLDWLYEFSSSFLQGNRRAAALQSARRVYAQRPFH